MSPPSGRRLLGTYSYLGGRSRVYRTAEAFEVDEVDHGHVTRKRVFFDDVVAVTHHRFIGWVFPTLTALGVAFFTLLTAVLAAKGGSDLWVALSCFGAPAVLFLTAFVLRLALQVDVVTVYGRRTKVELHFWFLKARARETFQDACRRVREAQNPGTPS